MNLEKTREIISDVATTETCPVFEVAAVAAAGFAAGAAFTFLGTQTPRVIPSKIQPFCGIHESAPVEAPQLWSFQVSGEDVEQQDGGLSPEELKFLKEFPMMKAELEAVIKKQRAIADDIDKTHKKFTQTNLVTDSIAVVSGTMNFLGLALAPVTAGGSLMLSAAGQGLGAVAGATSLATSVLEYRHNKQAQAQVSSEVSDSDQKVKEAVSCIRVGKTVYCFGKTIEKIENNMRALELVRAYPLLAEAAEQLLLTGQASARTTKIVRRAFRGTPLAMGTKALLKHGALAGLFLGMDMSSLEKDWKQLKEGAKTEEADQLRAQAEEWERKLAVLTQLYEHLQVRLEGGERD
uniref:Apolipoprotein L6 n=1 Tax=Pipistrellus kuhlii TaxID=59472 RepID=A0A7J7ZFI6_PIPKU|nr:apolipoprotein L6 [Pipistrellus kuhlii]